MKRVSQLRMALGGAICGSFVGIAGGALAGVSYGALVGNIGLGLDGALVGGCLVALVGAVCGAVLQPPAPAGTVTEEGPSDTDRAARLKIQQRSKAAAE